jgi:hypothetical protein
MKIHLGEVVDHSDGCRYMVIKPIPELNLEEGQILRHVDGARLNLMANAATFQTKIMHLACRRAGKLHEGIGFVVCREFLMRIE